MQTCGVFSDGLESIPETGCGSGSLVLCKTIVPESTVVKPQSTETMLLALWPDQSYEKQNKNK